MMTAIETVSRRELVIAVLLGSILMTAAPADGQEYAVPIRWCVVADDADGDGQPDAGEEGAPAFVSPGTVGEGDTDNVLWRRHERSSDNTYIPEAQITFRSAIYNIVEDATLRFPIIADPDPTPTDDAFWRYGDILNPNDSGLELNAAYNACVDAWREDHGVENIGLVVINANRVVDLTGDSEPGIATLSSRMLLLRDNAYVLPGSALNEFPVADHVDKHFGHEVGHALAGLRHTCDTANLMSTARADNDGDSLVDNFHLSASIGEITNQGSGGECTADDTFSTIDQIAALRAAAEDTPGCKLTGTDTDCTVLSDVRADLIEDAPTPFLDLSLLIASKAESGAELVHEMMGPFERKVFSQYEAVDFYVLMDQDGDASTGGPASGLGLDEPFGGAELVTRLRIVPGQREVPVATATAWRFAGGAFSEIADERIRGRLRRVTAIGERGTVPLTDQAVVALPIHLLAPVVQELRLQALVVGRSGRTARVIDRLDDRGVGRDFRWRPPKFPTCEVSQTGTAPGETIAVRVEGLLPERGLHVVFGDRLVGNGSTDAAGAATLSVAIPAGARDGNHLVTVGTDGTALTADCLATVKGGPGGPGEPGEAGGVHEYAAKWVCGALPGTGETRYGTIVNVRNPHSRRLELVKELALAIPPGGQKPGRVIPISRDGLGAGEALAADCRDVLRRAFGGSPPGLVEGFLVLRSELSLDVSAVYTSTGRAGGSGIDVERVEGRLVPRDPR